MKCRGCGLEFQPREGVLFCSVPCRKSFNNRRMIRGAAVYDLFMAMRYDRGAAKRLGIFAAMCALGQQYRQEDRELRHGVVSWLNPEAVLASKSLAKGAEVGGSTNADPEGSPDG